MTEACISATMESYLMMLYVTLEQESALKNFFVDHGWTFCKPDLTVTTDRLGPAVRDVQADSVPSEGDFNPRLLGKRKVRRKQNKAPVIKLAKIIPAPSSSKTNVQTLDNVQADSDISEQLDDEPNEAELQDIGDIEGSSNVGPKIKAETLDSSFNEDYDDDNDDNEDDDDDDIDTDVDESYEEAKADGEMEADVTERDEAEDETGVTEEAVRTKASKQKRYKNSVMEFSFEGIKHEIVEDASSLHSLTQLTIGNQDKSSEPQSEISETISNQDKNSEPQFEISEETSAEHLGQERAKKAFKCKICEYSTGSRGNLFRHQRVHTKTSTKCSKCDKSFSDAYDLKQHFRSIHEGLKLLCEVCSKQFNNRFNLRRHFSMEHTKQLKYKCEICEKQFFEKSSYLGHMNKHLDSRPYMCDMCSKSFYYKNSLQRHIDTAHQEKHEEIVCETCGAVFKTKATLKSHTIGKHGQKTFLCSCGKAFSWRPSLVRHKKTCKIFQD